LLAKLGFQVPDQLSRWPFAEFLRQLAAFGELGFYCLFFPIPVHSIKRWNGKIVQSSFSKSKQATDDFKLGH
jgi:hypothetical protein